MDIFRIVIIILGALGLLVVPLIFKLKKAKDDFNNAKDDADKQKAIIDMIDIVRQLIVIVEQTYIEATGAEKKSTVLTELKDYADKWGYTFDNEYWGAIIDNLVSMTNKVNIHK